MRGPRIALWGAFDVEDGGRLATRRVIEAELCRRLPGAVVTAFAPLGSRRPLALDGGRPAEPLSATGGSATGRGFDCILVCTEDALAAALSARVDGGEVSVQLVASGRLDGEDEFAAALERALDGRCRRVPGVATVEDHAAVIATSSAYAGPPGTGLWLAAALGIPAAAFTHPGPPGGALRDLEDEVRALREEADRLRAELRAARTANDLIVGSRTWRYTQPVRDTLARVRERRR